MFFHCAYWGGVKNWTNTSTTTSTRLSSIVSQPKKVVFVVVVDVVFVCVVVVFVVVLVVFVFVVVVFVFTKQDKFNS